MGGRAVVALLCGPASFISDRNLTADDDAAQRYRPDLGSGCTLYVG